MTLRCRVAVLLGHRCWARSGLQWACLICHALHVQRCTLGKLRCSWIVLLRRAFQPHLVQVLKRPAALALAPAVKRRREQVMVAEEAESNEEGAEEEELEHDPCVDVPGDEPGDEDGPEEQAKEEQEKETAPRSKRARTKLVGKQKQQQGKQQQQRKRRQLLQASSYKQQPMCPLLSDSSSIHHAIAPDSTSKPALRTRLPAGYA